MGMGSNSHFSRRGWLSVALAAAIGAMPFHAVSIHNAPVPSRIMRRNSKGKGKGRGAVSGGYATHRSIYAKTGRAVAMKGHHNRKRNRAKIRRARARRTGNR